MSKRNAPTSGPERQSCRLDAKNSFLEVVTDSFNIGKILVNFVQYDATKPAGDRQTNKIAIYMDPASAYALAKMITDPGKNGMLQKGIMAKKKAEEEGKKYPGPIWQSDIGGTKRPDGTAICRQLSIYPGIQQPYVITATSGNGKVTQTGGIVFDGAPSVNIRIPVDDFGLYKFAGGLEGAFIGFSAERYITRMQPQENGGYNNSGNTQAQASTQSAPKEQFQEPDFEDGDEIPF